MLTDERYKQLMEDVGMPNNRSLLQVLKQAVMEATLAERERCAMVCEKVEENGNLLSGGDAMASDCYLAIRNT